MGKQPTIATSLPHPCFDIMIFNKDWEIVIDIKVAFTVLQENSRSFPWRIHKFRNTQKILIFLQINCVFLTLFQWEKSHLKWKNLKISVFRQNVFELTVLGLCYNLFIL